MDDSVKNKRQVGSEGEPFAAEVPGRQPIDSASVTRGSVFRLRQHPGEGVTVWSEAKVIRSVPAKAQVRLDERSLFSGSGNGVENCTEYNEG